MYIRAARRIIINVFFSSSWIYRQWLGAREAESPECLLGVDGSLELRSFRVYLQGFNSR